jgi:hypothetical protein
LSSASLGDFRSIGNSSSPAGARVMHRLAVLAATAWRRTDLELVVL